MRKDLHIFIVDDDPICREMFRKYLLNMGFDRISLFPGGKECLDALGHKPAIILLDHHMEGLNGLETLAEIKRSSPDTYLVFVSGQEDMKVAVQAIRLGAFDYIIKGNQEEDKIRVVIHNILSVMERLHSRPSGKWPKFLAMFSV